jgi:hypothetical protein
MNDYLNNEIIRMRIEIYGSYFKTGDWVKFPALNSEEICKGIFINHDIETNFCLIQKFVSDCTSAWEGISFGASEVSHSLKNKNSLNVWHYLYYTRIVNLVQPEFQYSNVQPKYLSEAGRLDLN